MTEKSKKYEAELLKVIKDKKIAFFDHCFGFTSLSRTTAYDYKLNDSDAIKAAIATNRATAKNYMLNKWIAGDNPTLQIAAMRLLSDTEEHRLLNQNISRVEIETVEKDPLKIQHICIQCLQKLKRIRI